MSLRKAGMAGLAMGATVRPTKRIVQFFAPCAILCALLASLGFGETCCAQGSEAETSGDPSAALEAKFRNPPAAARPWTFWYWMDAAVSREGITADLEAMKAAGLGGAYLMPIKGPTAPPRIEPPAIQGTQVWYDLVRHAMEEADRLGLEFAMHVCDGFATAGGPWITPEMSMQRLVWSRIDVDGGETGRMLDVRPPRPATREDYYRDVAVLAFPSPEGAGVSTRTVTPQITTSEVGFDAAFLANDATQPNAPRWRSDRPGWIEFSFDEPFTARSMTVWPDGANYEALRLRVEARDEAGEFRVVKQLIAPRHGWQEGEQPWTFSLPATASTAFRFVFDPAGSEPGAEDLDSAKWKPVLKIRGVELSSEARIDAFEGKSGAAWRVAPRTTEEEAGNEMCVPRAAVVDVTKHMNADGRLSWEAPPGRWTVLRLGHTSTGKRNETAGGGKGLECNKLSAAAARLQYGKWFGEIRRQVGTELASRVLKGFHVDSWECGTQNWTADFPAEFRKRRGYDPLPWLPAMAGIPVGSAGESERFLHDVRTTIAELVVDNFYGALAELAHADGCWFSAECTSPTFVGDGMAHFAKVDVPMGEFWLRSPTHDKPNDMLDAVSAAHIYGKQIVQAEAFTELRLAWDESPATLKALGDRQFALGANRLVTHVFAHNPWLDRQPGMTLSGIGTFLQRDQTWWPMARGWTDYLARCQALLQFGTPVVDIAVFTGEEVPRRAVLPWELTETLPGAIGEAALERERKRVANVGQPQREMPKGVTASAGIPSLSEWPDPLRGYSYDSINRDALLRLATARETRFELPGGASYGALVIPVARAMDPAGGETSKEVAAKLQELEAAGVAVLMTPLTEPSFDSLGLERDFVAYEGYKEVDGVSWSHRSGSRVDVYFVSNQLDEERTFDAKLRAVGREPELWDPLSGEITTPTGWKVDGNGMRVPLRLAPHGSVFVVFRKRSDPASASAGNDSEVVTLRQSISGPWMAIIGGGATPQPTELGNWAAADDDGRRYFSGIASYETIFEWHGSTEPGDRAWLDLGSVADVAEVTVNGKSCGSAWAPPYRVEVTGALRDGRNELRVAVANTWHNRLVGDARLPEAERSTWTSAPRPDRRAKLLEAGLLGPVVLYHTVGGLEE
jgi:hypothetical protein